MSFYDRLYGSFQTTETEEDPSANPLDKLTDQQLYVEVEARARELKHFQLENKIFTRFLELNDPMELEGLENLMNFALTKVWDMDTGYPVECQDMIRSSASSGRRSIRHSSFSSLSSIFEGKGPKINLSQKTDMLLKAMEELQAALHVFIKKSLRTKMNVKGELEEYCIRERDIKESKESFEYNILVQAVDRLTQRIPAEKFIRWIEEWQKSAQLNIEKLRLRTASLKMQYRKVSATLIQRQELRQNVHAVDFDQLEIENKHFAEKLELKNYQLTEMKKMSGSASLVLNQNKKQMRIQQDEYNEIKNQVLETEKIISSTEDECETIEEELREAEDLFYAFKKLTVSYQVPDIMEYIDIKRQLNDLKNVIKVWHRRKKIQEITINACFRQMKNVTGCTRMDRSWLEDLNAAEAIDDPDEWWIKNIHIK